MTKRASHTWVRRAGFLLGFAAMAALLLGTRMPPPPHGLGLDLTVVPAGPERLTLKPAGPVLTASGMKAGGEPASGGISVVNAFDHAQAIRVRALPESHALDTALKVDVTLDGARLYRGPLGGLRRGSERRVRVESGNAAALKMQVWVPAGATGWRGRIEDLNLALESARATEP